MVRRFSVGDSAAAVALAGALAVILWSAGSDILRAGSAPWGWITTAAIGSFFLVGPLGWMARDRLKADRRKLLRVVGAGVGLVLLAGLVLSPAGSGGVADGVFLGGVVGTALLALVEAAVVPKRLRVLLDGESGAS